MTHEYHKLDTAELKKTLAEKETAWRATRFNAAGSKNTNVKASYNLRKDIARLLTILKLKSTVTK
jgi:ribosomal protein L29